MEKVPAGMPPGRCAKEFRIRCGQPVIRPGAASLPRSLWTPLTSCFQNCKIEFCSMILQFCRCGGLFDAKGNPDGFLSHFSSLRNFRLSNFPIRRGRIFAKMGTTGEAGGPQIILTFLATPSYHFLHHALPQVAQQPELLHDVRLHALTHP